MLLSSLAASAAFPLLEEGFYINLNGLGQFVRIIIESVGVVGVGVIVFALILKAITTPFDIYQRVKMRKQTLIMRKMQPELEKLQKQYANDKQTYSMKMYELQKKNGYSMLGACLPMIISLVILIIAITAFQSYAQYANLSMYERMAHGYNEAVLVYAVDGGKLAGEDENAARVDYRLSAEGFPEGTPVVDWEWEYGVPHEISEGGETILYTVYKEENGTTERMRVESASDEIFFFYTYEINSNVLRRDYYIDVDKMYTNQKDADVKAQLQSLIDGGATPETACVEYFRDMGAAAAAKVFRTMASPRFLWVKNVWYPDVSYNHPIQEYSSFTSTFRSGIRSSEWEGERSIANVISEGQYNSLTADLAEEKEVANGYFIMIIISIGLMLLSQFITMRSNKESDQYQTVDGQGANTQKIMLVVMPLMFAIFGFMWSAAFTIYNIISSALSILVTLITNLVIGRIFNKREEEEIKERYTRAAPWQKEEKGGKRKNNSQRKGK